ncbi:MAG: hypothetical protein II229_01125 [Clostridia bacterium]|nr:hypothetical protein [Clostridia bacterium]
MTFADVREIRIPEGSVTRLEARGRTVWEKAYLEITPTTVWLSPSALNDVLSNTDWQVT